MDRTARLEGTVGRLGDPVLVAVSEADDGRRVDGGEGRPGRTRTWGSPLGLPGPAACVARV